MGALPGLHEPISCPTEPISCIRGKAEISYIHLAEQPDPKFKSLQRF